MEKEFHTINPLFDFQILCDTDIGLYNLIKKDYYDRKVFNNNLFDSNDERFIKAKLLSRGKYNPLFIFCKRGIMKDEEMDDLYEQFLTEEYENILKLSKPTSVMDLLLISKSIKNVVNPVIICKSQYEIDWIHRYDNSIKCVISEYKDFDLTMYDTLYIKDIYNLLLFKQDTVDMKNIIIPRFMFNLEHSSKNIEMPIVDIVQIYYTRNKIMTADPYKGVTVPVNEMV